MDRSAWWATIHVVPRVKTRLLWPSGPLQKKFANSCFKFKPQSNHLKKKNYSKS